MEVMVAEQCIVPFQNVISSQEFLNSDAKLPLALGQCRNGEFLIADLAEMPHLLISGATGSGKSILLHTIINSLLLSNSGVVLSLIDPKRVEFSYYADLLNLHIPIARNVESSIATLNMLIKEMERRFIRLEKYGVRDISGLKGKMPFIVVIIDELADLMMISKKEVQELICRLAQKSRACGIHLVVATQRPSVDVVTGVIKANFPARISCQVSASIDSRVVLDRNGAEALAGKGDAIIDCSEHKFKRFKGSFLTEHDIVTNVKKKRNWWSRIWNT
jgi:S-DNA-T family DNA segregation ATPase FtsK/SpoIIIE